MSFIIPYDENLGKPEGAFIAPNDEILLTYEGHEFFSIQYCSGTNFLDFDFEDENEFQLTKLTNEQLELYKLSLLKSSYSCRNMHSDFMVLSLGFDKVERMLRRAITTTSGKPHVRFYNYFLMDWTIYIRRPMKYNAKTGLFEIDRRDDTFMQDSEDKEAEFQINDIKSRVLIKDRHHFFK